MTGTGGDEAALDVFGMACAVWQVSECSAAQCQPGGIGQPSCASQASSGMADEYQWQAHLSSLPHACQAHTLVTIPQTNIFHAYACSHSHNGMHTVMTNHDHSQNCSQINQAAVSLAQCRQPIGSPVFNHPIRLLPPDHLTTPLCDRTRPHTGAASSTSSI